MRVEKKLIGLMALFTLIIQFSYAQNPNLEWVLDQEMSYYANNSPGSHCIKLDDAGNMYIVGPFSGTIDIDPGPDTLNITSGSSSKAHYIQKLDSNGELIWVKKINDIGSIRMTLDEQGNVYVFGVFGMNITLELDSTPIYLSSSYSGANLLTLKLNSAGGLEWVRHFKRAGQYPNRPTGIGGIEVDNDGNIYTTGYLNGSIDFDPGVDTFLVNTELYEVDAFIHKLDSNGNFLWVKEIEGGAKGLAIALDDYGHVYTTGSFYGYVDFDPGLSTDFELLSGGDNIYIHKLTTDGDYLWKKTMGGGYTSCRHIGKDIKTDSAGSIYITGTYDYGIDVDPGPDTLNLFTDGNDILTVKLDSTGSLLWYSDVSAGSAGDWSPDNGNSLVVGDDGNVYTIGKFRNSNDFDPGPDEYLLNSYDGYDIFIQALDNDGNFLWAENFGGNGLCSGESIDLDEYGNIYATGFFTDSVDFDPGTDTFNLVSTLYSSNVFILKLYPCQPSPLVVTQDTLPLLSHLCSILEPTIPTAHNGCGLTILGTPSTTFPIIDQSIAEIIWTYDDPNGNTLTQVQELNWETIDVGTYIINNSTLFANNSNATYQWLDCANLTPVVGEIDQFFTPSVNGNYAVEITQNGCIDTSECVAINSIHINEFISNFRIYPNPSSSVFNIVFNKEIKDIEWVVTDIQGQTIQTKRIKHARHTIVDLEQLPPGVYFLLLNTNNARQVIKLIRQ